MVTEHSPLTGDNRCHRRRLPRLISLYTGHSADVKLTHFGTFLSNKVIEIGVPESWQIEPRPPWSAEF